MLHLLPPHLIPSFGTETGLTGTVTIPTGSPPFPAVLLIMGSSVHGQDETIWPNPIFRTLASNLSNNGFLVLLDDDSILNSSYADHYLSGESPDYWRKSFEHIPFEITGDVRASILILQGDKDFKVLHSEAGILESALREDGHPDYSVEYFHPDHLFFEKEGDDLSTGGESFIPSGLCDRFGDTILEWMEARI